MNLFRKKTIKEIIANAEAKPLKKTLGVFDLIMLGVGATIGTGVFVITGIAAAKYGGPAISLSYIIAAIACVFAALAYAEIASMVPVSGSAYTYSYAVMGEFVAWIVGWGLVLEYGIGASTVASGWSGYVLGMLKVGGIALPEHLTKPPSAGGIVNLPAILIVIFIGFLLFRGTKESVMLNRVLVAIKISVIFLFAFIATPMIKVENWANFMPFGFDGVMIGAATVFYAYIGFDAVSTAAEEAKNPERDLPIGIIGSLFICTTLYVLVALILTGISHYSTLDNAEPLARALRENGTNLGSALVATGAIAGITSVLLILVYGQSRIFFVMSRDKLISPKLSSLHKKYQTPHLSVILTVIFISLVTGFLPLETLSNLTSIGTLFAFIVVAIGALVLRITQPELKRSFKCPAIYVVAPLAVLSCGYLVYTLLIKNGAWFLLWLALGLVIYFGYGYRHSPLNKKS